MKRREYLTALSTAGATVVAGCGGDQDHGPQTDYEAAINTKNGKTFIDLNLETWLGCSYDSIDNYDKVPITIEMYAADELQLSDEWVVEYEECMTKQTEQRNYTLDEEWDDLLIEVEPSVESQ